MQKIRYAIYIIHWWVANAGIIAIPTYGLLHTQDLGHISLAAQLAGTLIGSAVIGLWIGKLRELVQEAGEKETTFNRVLYSLFLNGTFFATMFLGIAALQPTLDKFIILMISIILTFCAWKMRFDSVRLKTKYGLDE
jgi:flagellar biosynthesis component FlhA